MKKESVYVWTWMLEEGLCRFAKAEKLLLIAGGKPSPEAQPIRVRMMTERQYRKEKGYVTKK